MSEFLETTDLDAAHIAREAVPVLRRHAADVDAEAQFPHASLDALRKSGLFGLLVPRCHGGLGGGLRDMVAVAGILATGCLTTAMVWAMHCQQVDALVGYGTPGLKDEVLPEVAAGSHFLASVTTEPATGGHLLTADAPLTAGANLWSFRREAPVVTGGEHADGFLVTLRAAPDAAPGRVTLVFARRGQVDCQYTTGWDTLGMRGTRSVGMVVSGQVPDHQIVGEPGGFRTIAIESMIPVGHLGWAACWIGAAQGALSDVVNLARSSERPRSLAFDTDLGAARLGSVRMDVELAHSYLNSVTNEVAEARNRGRSLDRTPTQIHLNTLKVTASQLACRAADKLVQIAGLSLGYRRDAPIPLERHLRDLRSAELNNATDRILVATGKLTALDRSVRLIGA